MTDATQGKPGKPNPLKADRSDGRRSDPGDGARGNSAPAKPKKGEGHFVQDGNVGGFG